MGKFPNFCTPWLLLLNNLNCIVVVVVVIAIYEFSWVEFESIPTTKKIMRVNIHPISSRRRIKNQPNPMQHKIISFGPKQQQ
jgi:hypothetical protein